MAEIIDFTKRRNERLRAVRGGTKKAPPHVPGECPVSLPPQMRSSWPFPESLDPAEEE